MSGDIAMQMRCIHCRREQYGPAVLDISHGKQACPWCGEMSKEMTVDEYGALMREYWNNAVIRPEPR